MTDEAREREAINRAMHEARGLCWPSHLDVPDYCSSFDLLAKVLATLGDTEERHVVHAVMEALHTKGSDWHTSPWSLMFRIVEHGPLALARCIAKAIGRMAKEGVD